MTVRWVIGWMMMTLRSSKLVVNVIAIPLVNHERRVQVTI